jgi:ABC-type multidrug transport system, ATPase and permease components
VSGVLGDPEPETLLRILAGAVVGLFILKDLGSIGYAWWLSGFKVFERVKLQNRMLRHFLTSPYTFVSRRSSSEMIRVISDAVTQVFGTVVFGLMGLVSNIISIIAILVALMIAAPAPTLAVLVYFSLASLAYFTVIKPIAARAGAESARASRDSWGAAFAALGGIKEIKVRNSQTFFVDRFREAALRGAHASRTAEILGGLPRYLLEILFILAVGVFLLLGTDTIGSGSTLGILSLFVAAGFRVLPSVTGLLGNLSNFRFGAPYLGILHAEVMAAREIEAVVEAPRPAPPVHPHPRARRRLVPLPRGRAGRRLPCHVHGAPRHLPRPLVGGSGAGKTTLADLILGLHDPGEGRILVDGVDIAGRKSRWQRRLGYVPQDIFFLDATLAENIAFDVDRTQIDDARLARAIHQAQLEELVAELPEGVNTPLGEHGSRLSGGQRQRVGIARALYRQPELLVMDEATAALDNETEHRLTQAITALHGDITVILIAHRLSTVRHCDQLVFLKDGQVEAVGGFEEVRERSPDFAELVRLGSLETPATLDGPA